MRVASRARLHAQAGRHQAALDYDALLARIPSAAPPTGSTWHSFSTKLGALPRPSLVPPRSELDPKLDRAWYGLGLVLIRLQRFDEAVVALKRNTELQPMSPLWLVPAGARALRPPQPDEAQKIIRHLKGFEPKVAAQLERETGLLVGERWLQFGGVVRHGWGCDWSEGPARALGRKAKR